MNYSDIKYETPSQPRQVRLDTICACNASCPSCHRFLTTRKGVMTYDYFKWCLESIQRLPQPLTEIIPVNYGELMLREDWEFILRTISTKLPQTQIVLPTNGSKFTDKAVDILCEIPTLRVINFSVNAYFDETYEWFMGLPASNIRNIEKSIKRLKMQNPKITIWVSQVHDPMYQTDKERDLFVEHWRKLGVYPQVINAASAKRPDKKANPCNKVPCRSIFSDFVIGYDGKLSSCCFDAGFTLQLGNATGDIVKDWLNPELTELRKLHNEGRRQEIPLCRECTFG